MGDWIILYTLEDGTNGEVIVSAVNKVMAWDEFEEIVKANDWQVTAADCCRLTHPYEPLGKEENIMTEKNIEEVKEANKVEKKATVIELIRDYYDQMGEKYLKKISQVDKSLYCVAVEDGYKRVVSTLVAIEYGGDGEYAVERDFCLPGEEEAMIAAYCKEDDDDYDSEDDSDEWNY